MARTKDETIRVETLSYLAGLDLDNLPSPADIQGDILDNIKAAFDIENSTKAKGEKWKVPDELDAEQVATIILHCHHVKNITSAIETDSDTDMLAIYQEDGVNKGLYVTSEKAFREIARKYSRRISYNQCQEMLTIMRDRAERVLMTRDENLVFVNNGIFDFKKKVLLDFSPDYIKTAKVRVDYNLNAKNVVISNPDGTNWDIETWMSELHDDSEIVDCLWKVIGAVARPDVKWGLSAWFYSNTGNNGKGTLCELMRQLCGEGSYASISLSDFSKDFMLEPLVRSTAIIVDENDVGTYIDKAANLKAVITGDTIQLNRKFKAPIAFQFKGFMVQCLNEYPRIKDKSDSFYRRQLFIPFDKCFTGVERKYIKYDYLHRRDVLEYVLYRVLHMDYDKIEIPEACKNALEEYKEYNDPVRQFLNEILPQCKWDLLPFTFLHDLYVAWYKRNYPSDKSASTNGLTQDILNMLADYPNWFCENKNKPVRTKSRMNKPEPLIAEYNLTNWMNKLYTGNDIDKRCMPNLKTSERGLVRVQSVSEEVSDIE